MYSVSLRPGIALGRYPERQDPEPGWLERAASSAGAVLTRGRRSRSARFAHVTGLVHEQSTSMTGLSDAAIGALTHDLRARLTSQEHTDALIARAFAVISETAGRTLGMRHFDTQIIGGWVMFQGMLAEMDTGEGKTLTAALPAATAALARIPVHLVTVNDYLAERDAEFLRPLYESLGLSVGTVTEGMQTAERQAAYACDITYCTNKQLTFDYLKDRLVLGRGSGRIQLEVDRLDHQHTRRNELLLRGLCFAIVDEADSVLVDEARTPLILSRPGDNVDHARAFEQALALAGQLVPDTDFTVDTREREIELTDDGKARLARLTEPLQGIWSGTRRREEMIREALSAQNLFVRDKHYLVKDDKVQIIDEYTGRAMPDRAWERGLHQMMQAKEGVEISARNETLARISYQRFFRRYLRLAGMSGTAREVTRELWSIYRLNVVRIPTHRPCQRRIEPDRVFGTKDGKWRAVIADIRERHGRGQPVLVGTRTVADSEHVSELLNSAGLQHRVLNARQDQHEAEIIAQAGQPGRITVATNMAGRGTDIRLAAGVAETGGLHVILTERHDAGRIDRQLAGRCARQGDPGSAAAFLSLEDDLPGLYYPEALRGSVSRARAAGRPLPRPIGAIPIRLAQATLEWRHAVMRRDLQKKDQRLNDQLAFAGQPE